MRKLKCFRQRTAKERSLLMRVFAAVIAARVSLCVLPVELTRRITKIASAGIAGESIEQLVWAVKATSRFVPGASCLTQAIAAQAILARSGIASQVEVGVSKNESHFHAHAWVVCQGRVVLGGQQVEQYNFLLAWEQE